MSGRPGGSGRAGGRAISTSQQFPSRPEPGPGRPVRSNGPELTPLPGSGPRARQPAPGPEGPDLRVVLISRDKMLAGALRSLIDAPGGVRMLDWYSEELDTVIRHADVVIVDMPPTLHERTFAVLDGRFLGRTVVLLQEGEHVQALPPGPPRTVLYRPLQIGELWSTVTGVMESQVTDEVAPEQEVALEREVARGPEVGLTPGAGQPQDRVAERDVPAPAGLALPEAGKSAPSEPEIEPDVDPSPEPEFVPEPDPAVDPEFAPEPSPPPGPEVQPDPGPLPGPEVGPDPEVAAIDQPPAGSVEEAGDAEGRGLPVSESGRLIGLSGQELDPVVGPGQVAPGMDEATFQRLRGWKTGPGARQPAGRKGPAPAKRRAEAESQAARRAKAAEAEARREQARQERTARAESRKAARAEAGRQRVARADARTAAREEQLQAQAAQAEARRIAREERQARAEEARQAKAARKQERQAARAESRQARAARAEARRVARDEARRVQAAEVEARRAARDEERRAQAAEAEARRVARDQGRQIRAAQAEARRAARAETRQAEAAEATARRAAHDEARRVEAAAAEARKAEQAEARRVAREESRQAQIARAAERRAAHEEAIQARAVRKAASRQARSARAEERRAARAQAREKRAAESKIRREQALQATVARAEAREAARAEARQRRTARAEVRKAARAEARQARAARADERRTARAAAAQARAAQAEVRQSARAEEKAKRAAEAEVRRQQAQQAKAAKAEAQAAARAEASQAKAARAEERRTARAAAAQAKAAQEEAKAAARREAEQAQAAQAEERQAAKAAQEQQRQAAKAEAAQKQAAEAQVRREQAQAAKAAKAEARAAARAQADQAKAARAEARKAAREQSGQQRAARAEARRVARAEAARERAARRAARDEARPAKGAAGAAPTADAVGRVARPAVVALLMAVLAVGAAGWVGSGGADTRAGEVAVVRAAGGTGGGLVVQDPRVGPIEPVYALGAGVWLRATEVGGSLEAVVGEARVPSRFLLAGVVGLTVVLFLLLMRVGPGSGAAAGPGPAPPQGGRPGGLWRLGGAALAGALVALDPLLLRSGRAATGTVLAVLLAVGTVALAWGVPARPALRWLPLVAAGGGLALLVSPLALPVLAVPVVAELLQGRYQEAWKDMAALGLAIGLWLLLPVWVAGQDLGAGQAGWLLGRPQGRGSVAASVAGAPLTWLLVAVGLASAILTWRHRSGARSDAGPGAARLLAWSATSAAGALAAIALGYPAEQALPFAVPAAAVSVAVAAVTLVAAGATEQARRAAGGDRGAAGVAPRWIGIGTGVVLVGLLAAQTVDWAGRYGGQADDGLRRLVATVGAEVPECSAVNASGPDDRARLLAAGVTVTEFSNGPAAHAAGVRYFVLTGGTAQGPPNPSLAAWVRQHGTRLAAHPSRSLSGVELWRVDAAPLDPVADLLPLPDGVFSNTTGSACGGYRVVDSQAGTFHSAYRSVGGKAVLGRPLGSVWTSDGPALQAFDTMVLGAVPAAGGPPAVRPIELPPLLAKLDVEAVADADIPLPSTAPPVTNRQTRALLREKLIARAYLGTDPATATAEDFARARDRFGRPLGLPQMMPDGAMRQPFERAVLELPADGGPVRPAALGQLAVRLGLVPRQAMRPEPVPGLPARPAETRLDPAPLLRLVGGALALLLLAAGAGAVVAWRQRTARAR